MAGGRKDLDAPSLLAEVATSILRIHKGGIPFVVALQKGPILPGQKDRESFSLPSRQPKLPPSSAVVIMAMGQKNPLQNNSHACQPLDQALPSSGIDKEGPFRIVGMAEKAAADGISAIAHIEWQDPGREGNSGRRGWMKVQGGHCLSVKPQDFSQAHQLIGLGGDLS
jgi:hypothetical protein